MLPSPSLKYALAGCKLNWILLLFSCHLAVSLSIGLWIKCTATILFAVQILHAWLMMWSTYVNFSVSDPNQTKLNKHSGWINSIKINVYYFYETPTRYKQKLNFKNLLKHYYVYFIEVQTTHILCTYGLYWLKV